MQPLMLLLLSLILGVNYAHCLSTRNIRVANYTVSQSFVDAVDAGIQQMTSDSEWVNGYSNLGIIFPVPTCVALPFSGKTVAKYPSSVVWPRTNLTLCYEVDALFNWPKVHELAGKVLMRILNNKYGANLNYWFMKVNTTKLGYFTTMKGLVDSDSNRLPQVHFNCPYGASSPGFLRSSLDNETLSITTEKDMNQSSVTIVTYAGSYYDTYAKTYLQAAKLIRVPSGYTECFPYIIDKKAHIMLGDVTDLFAWLNSTQETCGPSCFAKPFGSPFTYGSFITNNIKSSAMSTVQFSVGLLILLICSVFLL